MSEIPLYNAAIQLHARDRGTRLNQFTRKERVLLDNLLVRIHFIIEMIWWTSLEPWELEFPFPGSLTSTFPVQTYMFKIPW